MDERWTNGGWVRGMCRTIVPKGPVVEDSAPVSQLSPANRTETSVNRTVAAEELGCISSAAPSGGLHILENRIDGPARELSFSSRYDHVSSTQNTRRWLNRRQRLVLLAVNNISNISCIVSQVTARAVRIKSCRFLSVIIILGKTRGVASRPQSPHSAEYSSSTLSFCIDRPASERCNPNPDVSVARLGTMTLPAPPPFFHMCSDL